MHKDFSDAAWADYTYWITQDKKTLKKINQLLADIERNGTNGRLSSTKRLKMASLTASGRSGAAPFSLSSQ